MFPDVRLLILALLTSVVALSGGFGVFAAFRVNHEPLSRLPAGTAPLQLVADEPAAPAARWSVSFGSRSPLSEAPGERATVDTLQGAPVRGEPPEPAAAMTVETVKPMPSVGVRQPPASQPDPSPAAAQPAPAASTPGIPAPAVATATADSAPVPQAPPVETQAVQPAPAAMENAAGKTADQPVQALIPAVAAAEPAARPAAPTVAPLADASPVETTGTARDTAAPEAKAPENLVRKARPRTQRQIARKTLERRRLALRKRVTRTKPGTAVARLGGGNSTFRDPVFRSAANFQPRDEVRPRSVRKTATGSVPSNPTAWPNDE